MAERDILEAEILARARELALTEEPGGSALGMPLGMVPMAPAARSDGFAVAREMFLGVFVSQAIDQMSGSLENNKERIAAMAAEYAAWMVDQLKESISRGKVAMGMPPVPGSGSPPAGRLPW